MKEEIFAPILPLQTYENFEKEVIDAHILRLGKPLAIYYFGNNSDKEYIALANKTSSGALVLNDIITQVSAIDCGFGGVGTSGYGRVNGFLGF